MRPKTVEWTYAACTKAFEWSHPAPTRTADSSLVPRASPPIAIAILARVAKYDPLRDHLDGLPRGQNRATMTFARIEQLLGEPLPPSARAYDDWWRGRARWRKVLEARPWESVGWTVDDLDLKLGLVTFRRQT
jgi:hypothetical protein